MLIKLTQTNIYFSQWINTLDTHCSGALTPSGKKKKIHNWSYAAKVKAQRFPEELLKTPLLFITKGFYVMDDGGTAVEEI